MRVMDFDLLVIVNGKPLEELLEERVDTTWIPAPKGNEFQLFINNNSDRRVLAVPLIDGLSVMDGKPGNLQSSGYILGPHEGGAIPGWRIDSQTVAAFKFDSVSKGLSFFAKKDSRDVGVIQCAIFEEKSYPKVRPKYVPPKPVPVTTERYPNPDMDYALESIGNYGGRYYRSVEPPPPPKNEPPSASGRGLASLFKASTQKTDEKVAVGFGSATTHRINEVSFVKESETPLCVMSLRYDTPDRLAASGAALVPKATICDRLFRVGSDAMMAKRFDEAITAFQQVTKVRPDVEIGWQSLALACQLSNNHKGLLHATSALARLKHKDGGLWRSLGMLYVSSEAWAEAINAFDKYNELEHDKSDSWNCLGYALAKAGQLDEAWYCCNKAIEIDPESFNAWDSLGVVHLAAGRLDEAAQAFDKALALNPSLAVAWENLWTTYTKMNRPDDAAAALERLYETDHSRAEKLSSRC